MKICRGCGAPLDIVFLDLGDMPLANDFPMTIESAENQRRYPLRPYVCERCFLVQLAHEVPPEAIFSDYAYFSSFSDTWVEHGRRFASAAKERFDLGPDHLVIELASNDGYLLRHFQDLGVRVLGVEPAVNVAAVAEERGVPTVVDFFGVETAARLRAEGHRADLLVGNNVVAHVPDLHDFVGGFAVLLADDGVVSLEFPHLVEFLVGAQFDTVYHEHFSYLSLLALEPVLLAHGLRVFDVQQLTTHGGSIRVFACRTSAPHQERAGVAEIRALETAAGLHRLERYLDFGVLVERCRASTKAFVEDARSSGKRIVGYGAPAKGVTFMNYCDLGPGDIEFVVDRSPAKQGRFMPGVQVPIRAPEAVDTAKPEYLLILPWNLREEVMVQMARIREWGGTFVTAVPEVRMHT